MRLIRYLFTAVLALLFISCSKGRSSDEPKPNNGNGEQTTSSKQVQFKILLKFALIKNILQLIYAQHIVTLVIHFP